MDVEPRDEGSDDPPIPPTAGTGRTDPFAEDVDAQASTWVPSAEVASPFTGDGDPDVVDAWIKKHLDALGGRLLEIRKLNAAYGVKIDDEVMAPEPTAAVEKTSEHPQPPAEGGRS